MKNTKAKLKRCPKCALPETYPGIILDKGKPCNYCLFYDIYKEREKTIKDTLKKRFVKKIEDIKKNKSPREKYDCIVAYSGGKDSTYLLYYLRKRFKLKILAHILDNGFLSAKCFENIKKVLKALNIDHRFTRPRFDVCRKVFTYALQGKFPYPKEILAMMSPVCATCLGMVFGTTIKLAIKLKIPLMFVGFTPGQYPAISLENFLKADSCVFFSQRVYRDDPLDIIKIIRDPINEAFGDEAEKYFFKSQYIRKGLNVPVILFPFHGLVDYDEKMILKEISKLGWERPRDTDRCSTNCLLNTLGIYASKEQLGYHPYAGELSQLARAGKISCEEAVRSEKIDEGSFAIRHSLKKMGLAKKDMIF